MESGLYPRLEALKSDFFKELKDSEFSKAKILLAEEDFIVSNSILDLKHPLKSFLAAELILKNSSSEFEPLNIQIKLKCLNHLKRHINNDLIIKELKKIKKYIKNKLFQFDLDSEVFIDYLDIIKEGACLSEIYELVFVSDFFQESSHLLRNLMYIRNELLNYNVSGNIKFLINNAYEECDNLKMSYTKRFKKTLVDLINHSTLDLPEKNNLIILNNQLYNQRIDPSRIDNLCENLDITIKKLIKKIDNFESLPGNSNSLRNVEILEINQVIKNSNIDFGFIEQSFFNFNFNRNSSVPIYIEFETIFLYTINFMLTSLTICLKELLKFPEFQMKGLNLLKAFRFLKDLPPNISQTICEIMLKVSDPRYRSSYYKFFLRDMYKKIKFEKIKPEVSNTFISLALKTPIREVLERFNKSEFSLDKLLERVTPNIYFMSFPEKLPGITLKTQQITLKLFEEENFDDDHKLGGKFCVYLHELANYLQRACFDLVGEINRKINQDLDISETEEGGSLLENLVFGEELLLIFYSQSIFLLKGVYPDNIEKFKEEFLNAKKNDHKPPLNLNKSQDIITFGNCGSVYGLEFPHWLPCQLKNKQHK